MLRFLHTIILKIVKLLIVKFMAFVMDFTDFVIEKLTKEKR
jgi:hypothetical protein